jgi:hypothetical protein
MDAADNQRSANALAPGHADQVRRPLPRRHLIRQPFGEAKRVCLREIQRI